MKTNLQKKVLNTKKGTEWAKKKPLKSFVLRVSFVVSGPDGTRTRDPMRDRHVF